MSKSKILCYELNEVPWRVVDYYVERRPNSALAALLKTAAQFTTHTVDTGELHPWSTWPTVHRGVSNEVHAIHYLNQDLSVASEYPPVWQLLNDSGKTCGIFGSLQSYPPVVHSNMSFHIPDTFAAGPETIPHRCEPFQAFNLRQTGENKAVASKMSLAEIPKALGLLRTGIKVTTYVKIVRHLLSERRNNLFKNRRALLQPELAFDVFLSCLKKDQPDYVTFFSNHVAGTMHRYWKYTFPEDFDYKLESNTDLFHQESLMVAMDMFDRHLKELQKVADEYDYDLVVMSSMGQEAIERGEYIPELKLESFDKLIGALGIDVEVKQNLAMQPDVAFEFNNTNDLVAFQNTVTKLSNSVGEPVFKQRFEAVGTTLNLSLRTSKELVADKTVYLSDKQFPLSELGLELMHRDIGTGYHQPEGILIWQGLESGVEPRTVVDSRAFLPTLLEHFSVDRRDYMQPAIGNS